MLSLLIVLITAKTCKLSHACPLGEYFNLNTCQCQCNVSSLSCSSNEVFNYMTCLCEPKPQCQPITCPDKGYFDSTLCQCLLTAPTTCLSLTACPINEIMNFQTCTCVAKPWMISIKIILISSTIWGCIFSQIICR